jgi:hypothetical protein
MTMRLICEYPSGTLRNAVTVSNHYTVASGLRSMPGIGKPFLIYETLPGPVVAADFELHQNSEGTGPKWIVNADPNINLAMIEEQLADPPLDALTFA